MLAAGTYKEGDYVYDGEWHEDIIQGMGKFTYASGACYEVCSKVLQTNAVVAPQ
jgi:hypothetical protein